MDFPFQWVDGFFKIYFVEPRAKRLSHEKEGDSAFSSGLLNADVKQEFVIDFTLEMNWYIFYYLSDWTIEIFIIRGGGIIICY